jgi:hypothetical protein
METVKIYATMLGMDATEDHARQMVNLLRAEGYDARYVGGNQGDARAVPDDVWERLLAKIGQ